MRDIRFILERYGSWVAAENSGLSWKGTAAGFTSLLPSTRKISPQCSDEDGLAIDGAMRCLLKKNVYNYDLIGMYYIKRLPLRIMAKKLKVSHSEVAKRLQNAEGFIEGCLAMADIILEMDRIIIN